MERAFDAGAVVGAEVADVVDDVLEVVAGGLFGAEAEFAVGEARFGQAAEVHDDFDEIAGAVELLEGGADASENWAARPGNTRGAMPRHDEQRLHRAADSVTVGLRIERHGGRHVRVGIVVDEHVAVAVQVLDDRDPGPRG